MLSCITHQKRYQQYEKELGVYGAFKLPEGALCRHHSEEHIRKLFSDFAAKEYRHLTYTTMNGHQSPGFSYIGSR